MTWRQQFPDQIVCLQLEKRKPRNKSADRYQEVFVKRKLGGRLHVSFSFSAGLVVSRKAADTRAGAAALPGGPCSWRVDHSLFAISEEGSRRELSRDLAFVIS